MSCKCSRQLHCTACTACGHLSAAPCWHAHGLLRPALVASVWIHTSVAHEHACFTIKRNTLAMSGRHCCLAWPKPIEGIGCCHMCTTAEKAVLGSATIDHLPDQTSLVHQSTRIARSHAPRHQKLPCCWTQSILQQLGAASTQ